MQIFHFDPINFFEKLRSRPQNKYHLYTFKPVEHSKGGGAGRRLCEFCQIMVEQFNCISDSKLWNLYTFDFFSFNVFAN